MKFRIQPKELRDGTLPYPYFIGDNGLVGRQDFWKGEPYKLLGFSRQPVAGHIELSFSEFARHPQLAIDKYPVFANGKDVWTTQTNPIESVKEYDT